MKNALWLFIVAVFILFAFLPSYSRMQDLRKKNVQYQDEIKALIVEKAALIEEKRLLEEDPEYLEKVAREKMGLIRKGEVVYKLSPVKNGSE